MTDGEARNQKREFDDSFRTSEPNRWYIIWSSTEKKNTHTKNHRRFVDRNSESFKFKAIAMHPIIIQFGLTKDKFGLMNHNTNRNCRHFLVFVRRFTSTNIKSENLHFLRYLMTCSAWVEISFYPNPKKNSSFPLEIPELCECCNNLTLFGWSNEIYE